jgi:hypothetical protein
LAAILAVKNCNRWDAFRHRTIGREPLDTDVIVRRAPMTPLAHDPPVRLQAREAPRNRPQGEVRHARLELLNTRMTVGPAFEVPEGGERGQDPDV